jgi:hypothetical protein
MRPSFKTDLPGFVCEKDFKLLPVNAKTPNPAIDFRCALLFMKFFFIKHIDPVFCFKSLVSCKYMRSMVEVDEPSVDKIIIGEPNTGIEKIGTSWMPYWSTLKEAKLKGINTVVTHEPTFYAHHDLFDSGWKNINNHDQGKKEYLKLLNKQLPELEVIHLPQGCSPKWIS